MLLALLFACSNVSAPSFGGGGHRYTTGEAGTGGGGGDDTATGETGDTGYELEEGAPELGEMTLIMETDSDEITYVLGQVDVSDDQNDIAGGDLFLDLTTSSTADERTLDVTSSSSDGEYAYASSGSVVFYVEGLNPELEYLVQVQLRDEAGHLSNVVADSVGPVQ